MSETPAPLTAKRGRLNDDETERLVTLMLRHAGETEPADPEEDGTYLLSERDLRNLFYQCLELAAQSAAEVKRDERAAG